MKELSTEEKAKAYDAAIKKAESLYKASEPMSGCNVIIETLFPELKESEDEKVRKEIIYHIKNCDDTIDGETEKRMVAWLENIPYTIDHEKREGFHLGYKAGLEKQGEPSIKWNKNTEGNKPQVNHSVLMKTTHGIAEGEWQGEYWHQYRWAGIVRDSDVLSWIELSDLDKQGEQKPAWSEKDEKEYKYVLKFVDNILNNCGNKKDYEHCKRCYDWLKSLKPQNTWKPSDEQMKALDSVIDEYDGYPEFDSLVSLKNDLRKL